MVIQSVEGLCDSFRKLELIFSLRDAHENDTCVDDLQQLKSDVEYVKRLNVERTSLIREAKRTVENIQTCIQVVVDVKAVLTDMVNNLPSRLPKPAAMERKPHPVQKEASVVPSNQNSSAKQPANKNKPTTASANHQPAGKQVNIYFPEVEFLTVDEFNQVPKYLKGRLSYDQINKFVEGMNTAFKIKYKILKMKKSTMNDANRKKYDNYQRQVTKDTKDCYFIVDEDIKEYGGLKIDSSARSTLTILRHCGRVHEVHGGKLTRYVYLDHY